MSDEATCGQGLAEHATLPAALAALTAGMAEVLDGHRKALDLRDENARVEDAAYATLTGDFRDVSAALKAIADRMSGYRDLPMARHDQAVMMSADAVQRFESFVAAERELLHLLEGAVRRDDAMLASMRHARG